MENGQDDKAIWLRSFLATLRGVVIDWYTKIDQASWNIWESLKKAFEEELKLLGDDNKIVAEIYNTKQGMHKNLWAYNRRLKELLVKLET